MTFAISIHHISKKKKEKITHVLIRKKIGSCSLKAAYTSSIWHPTTRIIVLVNKLFCTSIPLNS